MILYKNRSVPGNQSVVSVTHWSDTRNILGAGSRYTAVITINVLLENYFYLYSLLFNSMFMHGYARHKMLIFTIVLITKNRKKYINDSDNYRGIALSSVLGKILDWVIQKRYEKALQTSDMQFGFKEKHSTTQCTLSMKETIQYYTNSGGHVYLLLLDTSRAFERTQFVKMFKCLIERDLCHLITRFIVAIFINQQVRVKWGNHFSKPFVTIFARWNVINSIIYIEINCLRQSKLGCYVRVFSREYRVLLNPTKSKLIAVNCATTEKWWKISNNFSRCLPR